MKVLYYDCFAGISGDMNLGAMIDCGVEKDYLHSELQKLKLEGYRIAVSREKRNGIEGTNVDVILETHSHVDNEAHDHSHKHPERNFGAIENLIKESSLADQVKNTSIEIFRKIAEAESKVHGMPVDKILFHEVGAVDSIVDIVGAAICFDYLKVEKVLCSTIELGGGFVTCKHGKIPIPAPATVEILKGIPTKVGTVQVETTTPTGAAILATLVDEFTDKKEFVIERVAYGIGQRKLEIPNVLRVYLCDSEGKDTLSESSTLLECNIDDMNPELYENVMDKLFAKGADDVYFTPITMKKTRPAITVSVLCKKEIEEAVSEILFTETSTLGLRKYSVDKMMLQRKSYTLNTVYGEVTIKSGYYKGKMIKSKPEYNDCKRIAQKKNISIQEVYREIESAMRKHDK